MVTPLTDDASGWDLLGVSLGCISLCLVLLVKLLLSIFKGRVAIWMRFAFNLEFRVPEIGNYVIVLSGCGITILMQSSSVTNSTLSLFVAVGPLRLVEVFPFTVGTNVRTTVSGFRYDSCAVSPLLHIGRSAHLVPTAICSDLRIFGCRDSWEASQQTSESPTHWLPLLSGVISMWSLPSEVMWTKVEFLRRESRSHLLESPGTELEGDLHRTQRDGACIWPR